MRFSFVFCSKTLQVGLQSL